MMNSKLANALDDAQKLTLNEVCRTFTTYSDELAFKYLWNLTYKPEYALDKMGLFEDVYLTYYKKVRNYIAEESGHIEYVKDVVDLYEPLYIALQQDKFAVKYVIMVIDNALFNYPMSELERIKNLLNSSEKNCQFGGLKSLKLNNDEANYLIGAVEAISNYFVLKLEEVKKNCGITQSNQEATYENKVELLKSGTETISNVKEAKVDNTIPMVEKLLKNKDSIDKFLEVCYANDTYESNCDKWNVSWLLENPDIFKKVILISQIWNEIKSEIIDYNLIFKKIGEIEKCINVIKHTDNLKELGLNAQWIWNNRHLVVNLFEGLEGAAL